MTVVNLNTLRFMSDLQGNILKSHGRSYISHLMLRFTPGFANTARAWLKHFAENRVTSALDQYQAARRKEATGKEELFAMVLLSAEGYRALGYRDDNKLPDDGSDCFSGGMASRPLNDPQKDYWELPYNDDVHAMILLAHEDPYQLRTEVESLKKQLRRFCEGVHEEKGKKIKRGEVVIENFGYADGISQPLFIRQDIEQEIAERGSAYWNPQADVELVLVKETWAGSETYGSFMVFRKLEQNVQKFDTLVTELAEKLGKTKKEAGAYALGRDRDGRPLIETTVQQADAFPNDFNFAQDEKGEVCPLHAHIRKANPRGNPESAVRIVRRSITYGDYPGLDWDTAEAVELPEKGVGLLFMSFQSKLKNFEILHAQMDDENFIKPGVGVDAIMGRSEQPSPQTWPGGQKFSMANLVTFKGGEYFFAPSLPFLKGLEVEPLTDLQKARFDEAAQKLVEQPAIAEQIGQPWALGRRMEAVRLLSIQPEDFDNFYAYLVPYMFRLYAQEPYQAQPASRSQERVAPPSKAKRNKMREAFIQLLDPDKLQEFSVLWSENPEQALASMELNKNDSDAFYAYLRQYGVDLKLLIWG